MATVQELLDILQKCPKDAVVLLKNHSTGTLAHINLHEITSLPKNYFSLIGDKQVVLMPEEKPARLYIQAIPNYAEVFTLDKWLEAVAQGWYNNYDGTGYWCKDGKESTDEVFSTNPEDATHVAWYNK